MKYDIYIQDMFNSSIEASNTGDALRIIGIKINNQEILFDESKPKSVKVEISDE
jgi:hypothetical protein